MVDEVEPLFEDISSPGIVKADTGSGENRFRVEGSPVQVLTTWAMH
jgi:hypothetical protein